MSTILWIVLPILIAVGSALLAVFISQQRMDVQLARERQALSEARAAIESQKELLEEIDRLRGEAVSRKTMDDFLADLHTEQRRFVRQEKMLFAHRQCLVVQERIYFRNIPLCNWIEHEVTVDNGADLEKLAKTLSVFTPEIINGRSAQSRNASRSASAGPASVEEPAEAAVIKMVS